MAKFLRVFQVNEITIRGIDEMTMPEYCKKHHFMRMLFNPSSVTVDPNNPDDIALVRWSVVTGNLEATLEITGKKIQLNVSEVEVAGGDTERFKNIMAFLNETQWNLEEKHHDYYRHKITLRLSDSKDEYELWVEATVTLLVEDQDEVVIRSKEELAAKLPSIVAKYTEGDLHTTQEEIDEAILAMWASGSPVVVRGGSLTCNRARSVWTLEPVPVCLYAEENGALTVLRSHEMYVPGYLVDVMERAEALGIRDCQIIDNTGYYLDKAIQDRIQERKKFRERKEKSMPKDE